MQPLFPGYDYQDWLVGTEKPGGETDIGGTDYQLLHSDFAQVPAKDLSELGVGPNALPAVMSREEFEARQADLRRKREIERHAARGSSKDKDRELSSSGDISSMKAKHRPVSQAAVEGRPERGLSSDRSDRAEKPDMDRLSPRGRKRKSDCKDVSGDVKPDRKHKGSVFSRISIPAPDVGSKKRKLSETGPSPKDYHHHDYPLHKPLSNGYRDEWIPVKVGWSGGGRKSAYDHESSDEDYHFKRRRPSSSRLDWEEDCSRERKHPRDHERERGRAIQHR